MPILASNVLPIAEHSAAAGGRSTNEDAVGALRSARTTWRVAPDTEVVQAPADRTPQPRASASGVPAPRVH